MFAKITLALIVVIWGVTVFSFAGDAKVWFLATFAGLALTFVVMDRAWRILRDPSSATIRPYSFSRVQLAWWTTILFSGLVGLVEALNRFPQLDETALLLLGISGATTVSATVIDGSDRANQASRAPRHQNQNSESFFLDILSDANGVSIHRFQAVLFNLAYGIWFLGAVAQTLSGAPEAAQMPVIERGALALLGLSSGTYAAVKTMENK